MPGISTQATYTQKEIKGLLGDHYVALPAAIESGQNIAKGTVLGIRPTTSQWIAYDKDAASSAGAAVPDPGNTGNGTCSAVVTNDATTLTENITVTFSAADAFTVVGSVSGAMGSGAPGVAFTDANSKVSFTITAGETPFVSGDKFTFSTTAAGARVAKGIASEAADASTAMKLSAAYVHGCFKITELTGLNVEAVGHMNGKEIGGYLFI